MIIDVFYPFDFVLLFGGLFFHEIIEFAVFVEEFITLLSAFAFFVAEVAL